jgi:nicotinamide mononucleotide adenylyltransferase
MNNLKKLNSFITEKKVAVKRRYTEKYPAKNVSTAARVRNAVLDAVADGHLTEEEIQKILSEVSAHKRWLNRNTGLFNISEDESGVKRYSLSPYGKRVKNATRVVNEEAITEALKVPHEKPGMKKVNMFVGRFQPFTLGHVKVFEKMYKENGLPVVVFLVRGGNPDPEKRPFDENLQQAMFAKMAKQYPFLETAIVVPNGAIDTLFAAARPTYEPVLWGYGTDRKKAYDSMINKDTYREQLGVDPDFTGYEIFRTDDNISASKVRNALKIDDEKGFKKMTPKSIHSFYKTLQDILQPIKENRNMKNLKPLNEFVLNEKDEEKKGGEEPKTEEPKVDTSGGTLKSMKVDGTEYNAVLSTFDAIGAKQKAMGEDVVGIITLPGEEEVYELLAKEGGDGGASNESVINEEYVEIMDPIRMANAMGEIQQVWDQWKNGPMTEPNMIKPAQKELKGWLDRWFKQNIK